MTFSELFKSSRRHYYHGAKAIVLPIIILVIVKDWSYYIGDYPTQPVARWLVIALSAVLFLLCWSVSLCLTNQVLTTGTFALKKAIATVKQRLLNILAAFVGYIVSFIILHTLTVRLSDFLIATSPNIPPDVIRLFCFFFILGLLFIAVLVFSLFALPLIIITDTELIAAFKISAVWVFKRFLINTLLIYCCFAALIFFIAPTTLHSHFMAQYHIIAIFDVFVFIVCLPILNNLLCLSVRELKKTSTDFISQ